MADLSGRDLLQEWRGLMESLVTSAGSVAGRAELPRQLVEPMERQLELLTEIVERERRLQGQLVGTLAAPLDAVFDLLEQSAATLAMQAEALEAAGSALEEKARLVKRQAEIFDHTLGTLRAPAEAAKALASVEQKQPRKRPAATCQAPRRKSPKR